MLLRGLTGMALLLVGGYVKDCSPDTAIAKVIDAGVYPMSPSPGDTAFMWVNYDLPEDVTSGTATYKYTLNYIPFSPIVVPLCDQTVCPLTVGVHNMTGNTTYPDVSGRLEVQVDWKDSVGRSIWCVKTVY